MVCRAVRYGPTSLSGLLSCSFLVSAVACGGGSSGGTAPDDPSVVALTALSRHDGQPAFTLASVLEDEPLVVETPAGTWAPENYDGYFRGAVTVREALERSLNVPFARLGLAVGPDRIVATGRALGIESPLRPYPAIALGAFEVTPLEMARAFGVLAAGGWRADTRAVIGVLDQRGQVALHAQAAGRQAFGPDEAYLVTAALEGAVDRGTGRRLRALGYWGPVAAKSGTSSDYPGLFKSVESFKPPDASVVSAGFAAGACFAARASKNSPRFLR